VKDEGCGERKREDALREDGAKKRGGGRNVSKNGKKKGRGASMGDRGVNGLRARRRRRVEVGGVLRCSWTKEGVPFDGGRI